MRSLFLEYSIKKSKIKKRLREFKDVHKGRDADIFQELCFCLLTPQSKAIYCDRTVKELGRSGLLFKGEKRAVRNRLKGVRFPNNKADYLLKARRLFENGGFKKRLNPSDIFKTREWLVKNVKGLGYKEASHFLRNIGLGQDLAILDIHILKNLRRYAVVRKIPSSISKKDYLKIEERMREFSKRIKIPLEELDLLFWSQETGLIFK